MKYDFQTIINRKNQGSCKWNLMSQDAPEDIVPFSVADSDMLLAPEIKNGLIDFLANDGILGYSEANDEYYQAVINWLAKRHNYNIDKNMIVVSNGVVPALYDAINAFSDENDGIILFTPVYHPFYQAIKINHRKTIKCPLINIDGSYSINFEKFEQLAKHPNNKVLLLCNPHNPISRVWNKEELLKIADICLQNDIIIVSDEIHNDLIMPGFKHYPIASLSNEIENITITCTAPSKTFNLAGLQGSNIIIKNPKLKKKFLLQQQKRCFHNLNTMAYQATILAYNYGSDWLEEFIELIHHNYCLLTDFFEQNLPNVKITPLQGTYLVWLDFSKYENDHQKLKDKLQQAYLFFDDGYIFGNEGSGFQRINIACPSQILLEALERLKTVFQ